MRSTRILLLPLFLTLSGCQLPNPQGSTVQRALPAEEGQELFRNAAELNIPQAAASLNDTARVLAGLPAAGLGGGHPIRQTAQWQQHQSQMNTLWDNFEWRHGQPISQWSSSQIGDLRNARSVFYPFSGPDVLFAQQFFPGADTLVLCGLEPCEPLPPMEGLSQEEIANGLNGLASSLNTVMQFSFFITKDMRNDFVSTRFRGVLPVMLTFLARSGHVVESVDLVKMGGDGSILLTSGSSASGVMIRASNGLGRTKRIFYFRQDLSDGATNAGSPLLRFVSSLGQPPAFLKSASYLLHEGGFSNIRNYLLSNCQAIVQDPSGIPYASLVKAGHDIRLYGNYQGTIDLFNEHQQPDLKAAFAEGRHQATPLTFGVGYVFDSSKTCLMVARR
jgi:hypothetical protein